MKLFIIGNGFDKGHGLNTSYWDFRTYLKNMYPEFLYAFESHYYIYPANYEEAQKNLLWNELEKNLANIDEDVIIDDALLSRDFGIFMPKHLAGQWLLNSYKYSQSTGKTKIRIHDLWNLPMLHC